MDNSYLIIITALIAAIPGTLALLGQRRRDKVNETDKLTGAAMKMVDRHEQEIERLTARVDYLEKANRLLRDGALKLVRQVTGAGMVPDYIPEEDDTNIGE